MALQYSAVVVDAKLNAIEVAIGVSAVLKIRTGGLPAAVSTADTGVILATVQLPSDWMTASGVAGGNAAGVKTKTGTWSDSAADATGIAGHFRIYASDGTTPHIQGTVGVSATDMIVDSVNFTSGQSFVVNTFQITSGNFP